MKCRHDVYEELYWLDDAHWHRAKDIALSGNPHGKKCLRCGDYVPLGPSSDDSEAVKIEMLAAFLVNPGGFVHVAHKDHHDQDFIDEDYNYDFREDCIGCWAEELAYAIATHGEAGE